MRSLLTKILIVALLFSFSVYGSSVKKKPPIKQKQKMSVLKTTPKKLSIFNFCCLTLLELEIKNCLSEDKLKKHNLMMFEGPIRIKVRSKANFSNKTNPKVPFIATIKYWDMRNGGKYTTFEKVFPPIPEGEFTFYINLPEPVFLTKRNAGLTVCIKPKPPYSIMEEYPQYSCKQNNWCTNPY